MFAIHIIQVRLQNIVCIEAIWPVLVCNHNAFFVDEEHSVEWHISEFGKMAERLSGYTKSCIISFIDIYKKVERNFPAARAVSKQNRITLGKEFIRIADRYGMTKGV